jgi:hypothetical protein
MELVQTTTGITPELVELSSASQSPIALEYYLQDPSLLGLSDEALQTLDQARTRVIQNAKVAESLGISSVPAVYIRGLRRGGCPEGVLTRTVYRPPQ